MNAIKFWGVFAVGVAAGAAVALLYAPQTGARTRKQLRRNLDDANDYVRDTAQSVSKHAGKVIKQGRGAVEDVVARGRDVAEDVVASANSAAKRVSEIF